MRAASDQRQPLELQPAPAPARRDVDDQQLHLLAKVSRGGNRRAAGSRLDVEEDEGRNTAVVAAQLEDLLDTERYSGRVARRASGGKSSGAPPHRERATVRTLSATPALARCRPFSDGRPPPEGKRDGHLATVPTSP